ncbi:glucose-1-phosphate thymidylyltransferase [Streptomyces sp. NPDC051452]|uniref:glucose-1-phosphate thymidylyltransferase n=1 Tax=Streptomyces sp. NPDC051452 TaxID=3365654 RepID=UPI0037AB6B74
MKALVLSGGTGSRLRPFTYSTAKQLLPVANKPVLRHCLEKIRETGVSEVGIIVGDHGDQIRAAIGDGADLGLEITYIRQQAPLGLAHCIAIAAGFLGDEDFVMYLGDNILADGIVAAAETFRASGCDATVLVAGVPDPRAYGVAELDADGRILRLVEKPPEPKSDLAVIGVYFFTAAIHRSVAAIRPSGRGELEITDAIQHLLDSGGTVLAEKYQGYWQDTGRPEDLLDCNRELLARLGPRIDGEIDAETSVEGSVVVEAGAKVIRSRLVGPLVVGAGSVISDSAIGPGVAVGRECVVSGAGVTDSILLEGAAVDSVPALRHSIIGRWAKLSAADGTRPSRLIVGDHAQAEVAT